LRAVRLLPDVVKIGAEPGAALLSPQEEEQLSNKEWLSEERPLDAQFPDEKKTANREKTAKEEGPEAAMKKEPPAEPLKNLNKSDERSELRELNERIGALEAQLHGVKGEKQALLGKVASLEANLAEVKNASARKEQELTASVEAAREQARTEGKTQGHAEGLQTGREAALAQARTEVQKQYREKLSGLVTLFEGISARLEEHFGRLTSLNQPRMLRLWQEMLKKMLQRETSLAPDAVVKVLSDVLSRVSDKNHILIYASPEDMELLQDSLQGEFGDVLRGAKHLELKPDANVDKGSCIVETNLGVYDARWRTQLEQIGTAVEKLFQQLGKTEPPRKELREASEKPEEQHA
jgi:flagellar assembly protein FliH